MLFTICGICGVFAVTLIWIVQNCLQLLLCPVVSIIAIHFWMVLLTLTPQGFSVYRINWPAWWQSLLHLLAVSHCSVPFIGCQWGLEYFLRTICWPTKPCVKNSLFISTPCLPHRFPLVHWDQTMIIVCQSLGSRPILVLELFTLVARLFGTTCRCLSVQPFQLLPLRNIWRHMAVADWGSIEVITVSSNSFCPKGRPNFTLVATGRLIRWTELKPCESNTASVSSPIPLLDA